MKLAANIAGGVLGFLFVAFAILFALMFVFKVLPMPPGPPPGSPQELFMGALIPTGYMYLVKILEVIGGILVAIPRTRNWGLLVLGPIIVNILAFHILIAKGEGLFNPVLIIICLLAAFLLWAGRKAFAGLLN